MPPEPATERIHFIDIARFLAISLVFYGHFVERIMYLENPTAAAQYKFIYSFHMVVFFILAGYVFKERDRSLSPGAFLRHRLLSRLLPFAFFTLLFMIPAGLFPGEFFHLELPSLKGYTEGLVRTAFGLPLFCVPSWFLMMIFTVELIHYGVFRYLKSDRAIGGAILAFYLIGYLLNWKIDFLNPALGRVVGWNYLFIHEAIAMYAFYLLGVLMHRKAFLQEVSSRKVPIFLGIGMFLLVLMTYRLNAGHFSFASLDAVVILLSSHGHFFWFPLTAIAGSLMLLFFARAFRWPHRIQWMGQNTLLLMCFNGVFYHFLNPPMAHWMVENLPGTPGAILLVSLLVTGISLLLCIPFIHLFNRWIPQLVGKPKANGPLIKNLL